MPNRRVPPLKHRIDVWENGVNHDRALRGLTGLAAEDDKAFNPIGIGLRWLGCCSA